VATFEREFSVEPQAVWSVLEDAEAYAQWIAGAIEVVHSDNAWPTVGASFDFRYRWGPFRRSGRATVLEAHPPGHVRIRWSRGPFADSIADIAIGSTTSGCVVRVVENPRGVRSSGMSSFFWVAGPSANARSLDRLARLAQ
jgi:uncharacterized protein YndB with AHSA1/START domain